MAARFVYKRSWCSKNVFFRYCLTNGYAGIGQCRTFLSQAYTCEEDWDKRLESPLLKDLKMTMFFMEVDKKFQTKRLASGAHIDMFANIVTSESQLGELEHLLYRFRKTKRAPDILDSTPYAVIKTFLKFEDYDSLFRILEDKENYGIFPDFYMYNALMDRFLDLERYRDAANVAVLMMLQEDFENPISRLLGLYSCQMFIDKGSWSSWERIQQQEDDDDVQKEEETQEEEDEDDETLVRVPFLRNPWYDDHFDITDPKFLIGKTLYLIGREEDNVLGRTYQIIGLGMYNKWDKAAKLLDSFLNSTTSPVMLQEGVTKFKDSLSSITDEEAKQKYTELFEEKFTQMSKAGKLGTGDLSEELSKAMKRIPELEMADIEAQKKLFEIWETKRAEAFDLETKKMEKERRLQVIAEKKEELYWKEKYLFFYENKEKIMEELEEVENIIQQQQSKKSAVDTYKPPEIVKKKPSKLALLRKRAMVKKL